jgi:hypothetical protein
MPISRDWASCALWESLTAQEQSNSRATQGGTGVVIRPEILGFKAIDATGPAAAVGWMSRRETRSEAKGSFKAERKYPLQ